MLSYCLMIKGYGPLGFATVVAISGDSCTSKKELLGFRQVESISKGRFLVSRYSLRPIWMGILGFRGLMRDLAILPTVLRSCNCGAHALRRSQYRAKLYILSSLSKKLRIPAGGRVLFARACSTSPVATVQICFDCRSAGPGSESRRD